MQGILEAKVACVEGINLENFSQNILSLCMEQYFWGYGVICKYGTPYCTNYCGSTEVLHTTKKYFDTVFKVKITL